MVEKIDLYASVGYALDLLAQSEYHKAMSVGSYFNTEIIPALSSFQARFYLTKRGVPCAMVTWAWISEKVEQEIHATGRSLSLQDWNSGDRPFINDCVVVHGDMRIVARDVAENVFPDHVVTSLRRNPDASVRKINRWTGVNIRHSSRRVSP